MISHLSQSSLAGRLTQKPQSLSRAGSRTGSREVSTKRPSSQAARKDPNRRKSGRATSVVSCATALPSVQIAKKKDITLLQKESSMIDPAEKGREGSLLDFMPSDAATVLEQSSVINYKTDPLINRKISKSVPRAIHQISIQTTTSDEPGGTESDTDLELGTSHARFKRILRQLRREASSQQQSADNDEDDLDEIDSDEESESDEEEICQPCCRPGRSTVYTWIKNVVVHQLKETPPWYILILCAIQYAMLKVITSFILWEVIVRHFNLESQPKIASQILSSLLIISGLAVTLQIFVGLRLPVISGASLATMLFFSANGIPTKGSEEKTTPTFSTFSSWSQFSSEMAFVSMVIGSAQMLIGVTGMTGLIRRFLGPLTVTPLVTVYAIFIVPLTAKVFDDYWPMSLFHLILFISFTAILGIVRVPFCASNNPGHCKLTGYPFFRVLGLLSATVVSIVIDAILHDITPSADSIFTASNSSNPQSQIQWAYIPFPFQFGSPKVSMLTLARATPLALALMFKSIHDYFACARNCRVPPPPAHALNRGQFIEGLCTLIAGMLGLPPVSTNTGHVGIVGLVNVASRSVMATSGLFILALALIPKPVFYLALFLGRYSGSLMVFYVALTASTGLSNLYFVNMISTRNQLITGMSIMLSFMIPHMIPRDMSKDILLFNSLIYAGLTGFLLDLLLPSQHDDNGRLSWLRDETRYVSHFSSAGARMRATNGAAEGAKSGRQADDRQSYITEAQLIKRSQLNLYVTREQRMDSTIYDLPFVTIEWLQERPWTTRIPISPTFRGHLSWCNRRVAVQENFMSVSQRNVAA